MTTALKNRTLIAWEAWRALTPKQRLNAALVHIQQNHWSLVLNAMKGRGQARDVISNSLVDLVTGTTRPLMTSDDVAACMNEKPARLLRPALFTHAMLLPQPDRQWLINRAYSICQQHFPQWCQAVATFNFRGAKVQASGTDSGEWPCPECKGFPHAPACSRYQVQP